MKYKLITLPRGTAKIPVVKIGYENISLQQGASLSIQPQTLNYLGANSTYESSGYIFTIGDSRLLSNFEGLGINTDEADTINNTVSLGTNVSRTSIGTTLNITGTSVNTLFGSNTVITSNLTITGRDSGARITIPININKVNN